MMARWGAFFRDLPWATLEPDQDHSFASAGLGEARGLDRVTAAVATTADLAVAYLPAARSLTIHPGRLAGSRWSVEWFEPSSGALVPGGTLGQQGAVTLDPPFDEDAVLTVRTAD